MNKNNKQDITNDNNVRTTNRRRKIKEIIKRWRKEWESVIYCLPLMMINDKVGAQQFSNYLKRKSKIAEKLLTIIMCIFYNQ